LLLVQMIQTTFSRKFCSLAPNLAPGEISSRHLNRCCARIVA
jgi:hypothetical protein